MNLLEQPQPGRIEPDGRLDHLRPLQEALAAPSASHLDAVRLLGRRRGRETHFFSAEGRLLLNGYAERLANVRVDDRAVFAERGRALGWRQLNTLCSALRSHAEGMRADPGAEPPATQQVAAENMGVAPQALAYLFDAAGHLDLERVATLPQAQQETVRAALREGPRMDRSTRLLRAHQRMIEQPMNIPRLVESTGEARSDLTGSFSFKGGSRGALWVSVSGNRLLAPTPGTPESTRRYFAGLPRALRPPDMKRLTPVLQRRDAGEASSSDALTPYATAEAAGVSVQALNFLFDAQTGQLRPEQLASLVASQQEVLGHLPAGQHAARAQAREPRPLRLPPMPRSLPDPSPERDVPRRGMLSGPVVVDVLERLSQRGRLSPTGYREVAEQSALTARQMDEVLMRGGYDAESRPTQVEPVAQLWERLRVDVLGAAARPAPMAPVRAASEEDVIVPRARRTPARRPAPVEEPPRPRQVRARVEALPADPSWAGLQRPRSQRPHPAAQQRAAADASPRAQSPVSPRQGERLGTGLPLGMPGPGASPALPEATLAELDEFDTLDLSWFDASPPRSGTP